MIINETVWKVYISTYSTSAPIHNCFKAVITAREDRMMSRRALAVACFFLFATLIMVGRMWTVYPSPWTAESGDFTWGIGRYLDFGPIHSRNATRSNSSVTGDNPFQIPLVVHQMWKTGSSPPTETIRWRDGCIKLNPQFEFRMYDDDELLSFAEKHYPRYLAMFKHLVGVYMADMARVLVTYHYGGIYADLDFYCHRPYRCLLRKAMSLLHEDGRYGSNLALSPAIISNDSILITTTTIPRDILVVSREPLVHAVLFRNKSRVVIQDFFMATPRHPFFLWLLEDKLKLFNDSSSTAAAATGSVFPKGPFSYSIEKDIDRYLEQKRAAAADDSQKVGAVGRKKRISSHSSLEQQPPIDAVTTQQTPTAPQQGIRRRVTRAMRGRKASRLSRISSSSSSRGQSVKVEDVIIELREDVMHPLVDATNPRLYSACAAANTAALLEDGLRRSCRIIDQGLFFRPSNETVLVHMWTHVFLGWSMFRGIRNALTYNLVERSLPPSQLCADED